jgi:hypothetical protein
MKRLLTLTLVLVALATLTSFGLAQERSPINVDASLAAQPQPQPNSLSCCECLGKVTTLDLSTGQGGPIDPRWSVSPSGPAYVTPPFPGWILPSNALLAPAKWIQPVAPPLTAVGAGDYRYTVKFNTPKCTIPSKVQLDIKFAADNSAKVYLDSNQVPTPLCLGTCFKAPQAPVVFPVIVSTTTTSHVLEFVVHNDSGPSGFIANVKLTRTCQQYP